MYMFFIFYYVNFYIPLILIVPFSGDQIEMRLQSIYLRIFLDNIFDSKLNNDYYIFVDIYKVL